MVIQYDDGNVFGVIIHDVIEGISNDSHSD